MPDMTRRRFPKVLADELHVALALTRPLGEEKCMELLAIYRRNMRKGVTNFFAESLGGDIENFEPFPMEWFDKIKALDEAYTKLHHYSNGGASDYVAKAVAADISRSRASLPREHSRKADRAAVAEFLKSGCYATVENKKKKKLIRDAMEYFDLGERAVREIAKQAGLTKAPPRNN